MTKNYIGYIEFLTPTEREERKEEVEQDLLRHARVQVLKPFDLWEKLVIRGREEDNTEVMEWYQDILDLVPEAFDAVPDVIAGYE